MTRSLKSLAALTALALLASGCRAEPETAPRPTAAAGAAAAGDSARRGPGATGAAAPRPYNRVVTSEAETRPGLFTTHRIDDKLLYEIPREALNRDMLLVTQIAQTTLNVGYGGQALDNRVIRWERRGNQIMLRDVRYDIVADPSTAVYGAVEAANYAPIIAMFNVEAYGQDSAAVIDVTRLFTNPPIEFSPVQRIRGTVDNTRSYLERVASFPTNVEVRTTVTINVPQPPAGQSQQPGSPFGPARVPPGAASVQMHYSMVELPEKPMTPRLADDRVGFFTVSHIDFSRPEHRSERRRFITRYKLEKKNPNAAMSEPVEPIVYWVDPATPEWLVPYVKAGIEQWQPAFEAAGFINGIVAREAPSPEEDPDWSPEDARYSVVRWLPSTTENAMGPHVNDPRSGQIIEADVQMYHNVMNLLRSWYWVQVGALDPRARTLPLPDSLMGELVQYVVAHEVGHTLGLQHNMKASSAYPVDSIRNVDFLRRMGGHTPTLMDYSRFNYVAQPEDSIPVDLLIPQIGPYDKFAIMWGYSPIPGASTPDAERPTLDRWARMQDTATYLRFSTRGAGSADPGSLTEAVGDHDAVYATELGLRNIKRLVPMLIPATEKPGESYETLTEMYGRLIGQWGTEMRHVATIPGGVETQERYGTGERFTPLPRARQERAVRFLHENAFATPSYLMPANVLRRISPDGAITRVTNAQSGVLNLLLADDRIQRLVEFELIDGGRNAYPVTSFLADVRNGIFSELRAGTISVDPVRRQLQRNYVAAMARKISPPSSGGGASAFGQAAPAPGSSDVRALARGELITLDEQLRTAIGRTNERVTRLHLLDLRKEIERALYPGS